MLSLFTCLIFLYANCAYIIIIFFSPGATQPIVGVYFTALYRALASSFEVSRSHTTTRHSR